MKKKLSILLVLLGLIFSVFSFSTNSFAIENDKSYEEGQVISVSDSLDNSYLTNAVENDISYEDGEIISVSDSLADSKAWSGEAGQTILSDSKDTSISPLGFYLYKDKTIVRYYADRSSIPDTSYYEEYTGGYMYSGNLKVIKTEIAPNGGWNATFTGKLSAWVN